MCVYMCIYIYIYIHAACPGHHLEHQTNLKQAEQRQLNMSKHNTCTTDNDSYNKTKPNK